MKRGILDALYWRLHTSYLLNDRTSSEKFLAMLVDEHLASPSYLVDEIGPVNYARYLKIKTNVENGSFCRLYGGGQATPQPVECNYETGKEERQFHVDLMAQPAALFSLIEVPNDALVIHELDLSEYGRCDFVFRHGKVVTVVEVKMEDAPTSVVSQIDKYRLGLELDMCLNLYNTVRAFVLAAGFGPYVTSELSRVDVGMIVHQGKPNELRLLNACNKATVV